MNASNSIGIDGRRLKVVRIMQQQQLFRADKNQRFNTKYTAANNYKAAPFKYFTLNKNELKDYINYGMPHMKTWNPTEELILLDILHMPTRKALAELSGKNVVNALNHSFPIKGNRVSRISEENKQNLDDTVVQAICNLPHSIEGVKLDGYYMGKIDKIDKFHSEVAICKDALHKLTIAEVEKAVVAPRVERKKEQEKRSRLTRKWSSNNNNNIPNSTAKKSRVNSPIMRGLLFENEKNVPRVRANSSPVIRGFLFENEKNVPSSPPRVIRSRLFNNLNNLKI